jgi:hypothetical protein
MKNKIAGAVLAAVAVLGFATMASAKVVTPPAPVVVKASCSVYETSNVTTGSTQKVTVAWTTTDASSVNGVVWYQNGVHFQNFANHATSGSETFSFPAGQGLLIFWVQPQWNKVADETTAPCVLNYSADSKPHAIP